MTRATVCLTFDFDAVSPWIHVSSDRNTPVNRSRGLFGATEGAPRLLDLLDRLDLPSTWFVPGHTVDSFPDVAGRVHDEGHEIQHHGWSHTRPGSYESREAERRDIERGIESVEDLTGRRPLGYRSPSWDFSEHTRGLLQELGFEWDSSGMASDFRPYWLHEDRAPSDGAYERGDPLDVVTIPVSWNRDDYPAFAYSPGKGYADEAAVYEMWADQFDWMYENVDGGVFVLTMHPQVSGRSHRLAHLEALVDHLRSRPDVAFSDLSTVAADFREAESA
ncbi:MAG: polysaccharide deacetylase [Haloferacaceae archaeon]